MNIKSFFCNLLFLSGIILLAACTIKEPKMPQWETPVNLPLGNFEFSAIDLVEDSTIFDIRNADSLIMIDIDGEIERQEIDPADLAIEGIDSITSVSIDTVFIDSLDILSVPADILTMGNLAPELINFVGSSVEIPAVSPDISPVSLVSGDFDSVHVTSGNMKLTITNNLPVAIAVGTSIQVYSHPHCCDDDSLLSAIPITENILPGTVFETGNLPLQYDWLISPITIHFNLSTQDSDGEVLITQDLLDNQGVGVSLRFIDLEADQATSRLSAHDYTWEGAIAVDEDSTLLYAGKIQEGFINFEIVNELPVSGRVKIQILNFVEDDLTPAELEEFVLLPEQTNYNTLNLNNMQVAYIGDDGIPNIDPNVPIDSIYYKIDLHQDKYEEAITIMAGDSMSVAINMDSLKFQMLKADIEKTEITIEPTETSGISDYEGFDGEVLFRDLALQLNIFNEFEIGDIEYTFNLWACREENGIIVEEMTIAPLKSGTIVPNLNNISITDAETDGKISALVNMMPTRIVIDGNASVEGLVKIELGNGIFGDYAFSAPFEIKILEPLKLESDPYILTEKDLGKEIQDAIVEDRVQYMEMFSHIYNELPVGGKMLICFTDDTSMVNLFDTTAVPFYVELNNFYAAEVDNNGFSEIPAIGENFINISADDIQLFANPPIKYAYIIEIDSTASNGNDGYIKLQSFNSANVQGNLKFKLKIDEDLFDE